jgi:hypothetical protein
MFTRVRCDLFGAQLQIAHSIFNSLTGILSQGQIYSAVLTEREKIGIIQGVMDVYRRIGVKRSVIKTLARVDLQ